MGDPSRGAEGRGSAAARILRRMRAGAPARGGLESLEAAPESADAEALDDGRAAAAHEVAVEIAEREWAGALDPALLEKLERIYLRDGVDGLRELRDAGEEADLSEAHLAGLEAIVETDGSRPTLQVQADDTIATDDPMLRTWQGATQQFAEEIARVAASVGRVDLDGRHMGTGWVVSDDLILTNRHVLQQIAAEGSPGTWTFKGRASLVFDAAPDASRAREFDLVQVVATGPEPIDLHGPVDYAKLDFALLRCRSPAGAALPDPLVIEEDANMIVVTRPVYTIGYPAKPGPGAYRFSILHLLFKSVYGVKRFAPGEIDLEIGKQGKTVFAHDATTLGGNSGSCVVDLGDNGASVAGLHFAGTPEKANYAHAIALLRPSLAGHVGSQG